MNAKAHVHRNAASSEREWAKRDGPRMGLCKGPFILKKGVALTPIVGRSSSSVGANNDVLSPYRGGFVPSIGGTTYLAAFVHKNFPLISMSPSPRVFSEPVRHHTMSMKPAPPGRR